MTKAEALKLGYCKSKNLECCAYYNDRQNCLPFRSEICPLTEDTIKLRQKEHGLKEPKLSEMKNCDYMDS